jgi:hypothetical protein
MALPVPIREAIIVTGRVSPKGFPPAPNLNSFAPDCVAGDTQDLVIPFPAGAFPSGRDQDLRVILTPQHPDADPQGHVPAPVGVAQRVSSMGFNLHARNSDCDGGDVGFNWLAILDTPGQQHPAPNLRMRVFQPEHLIEATVFAGSCQGGDTHVSGFLPFWRPLPQDPFVLLTATNLHIVRTHGFGAYYHPASAVGIVQGQEKTRFVLRSRNSDCSSGECAFFSVALTPTGGTPAQPPGDAGDLIVDTGVVSALSFAPDCRPGDTQFVAVDFHRPFLTPPVVLVTANDVGVTDPHNAAVVAMANDVTPHGFTLRARNSDCGSGMAGFYWVAFGCAPGCG